MLHFRRKADLVLVNVGVALKHKDVGYGNTQDSHSDGSN